MTLYEKRVKKLRDHVLKQEAKRKKEQEKMKGKEGHGEGDTPKE